MKEKVIEAIKQFNMLQKGDHVVIGLSGGADSICLTHILLSLKEKYSLELTAVHVNHNIRKDGGAENDQHFVEKFCAEHGLPLRVFSIDVEKKAKEASLTIEEAGRQQRYAAFESIGADKTAVAHNLNDNAETMLMRLCRGTGLKGMGGILPVRGNIIRPLIMSERSEIEQYCKDNGLDYCTDATNLTTDYTRNKIRHKILPLLAEINPNTVTCLGKNAFLFRQENDYLEELALRAYNDCAGKDGLDADKLAALEKPLLYRVLRLACENAVGLKDISLEHIEAIESLLKKESGKQIDLPKGLTVIREYNRLTFTSPAEDIDTELTEDTAVKVGGSFFMISRKKDAGKACYGIYCDAEAPKWRLRTRRNGDIFIRGDGRRIKLKNVFIDKKIPLSKRGGVLLLAEGENIYWADCLKNKFNNANYYLYKWGEKNE